MRQTPAAGWIRAGLFALPVYGVLTWYATLEPQPDQVSDPDGWARFVSSTSYLASHIVGNVLGTTLAIFGTFALGAFSSKSRAPRLALSGYGARRDRPHPFHSAWCNLDLRHPGDRHCLPSR